MSIEAASQTINGVPLFQLAPHHYRVPGCSMDVLSLPSFEGNWRVIDWSNKPVREFQFDDLDDAAKFVKPFAK